MAGIAWKNTLDSNAGDTWPLPACSMRNAMRQSICEIELARVAYLLWLRVGTDPQCWRQPLLCLQCVSVAVLVRDALDTVLVCSQNAVI